MLVTDRDPTEKSGFGGGRCAELPGLFLGAVEPSRPPCFPPLAPRKDSVPGGPEPRRACCPRQVASGQPAAPVRRVELLHFRQASAAPAALRLVLCLCRGGGLKGIADSSQVFK